MTFINYAAREINCKIVYYGPGLCGKTTNLQWIYDKTNPQSKGKLISARPSCKTIVLRKHLRAEAFEWIASTRRCGSTTAARDCCC